MVIIAALVMNGAFVLARGDSVDISICWRREYEGKETELHVDVSKECPAYSFSVGSK